MQYENQSSLSSMNGWYISEVKPGQFYIGNKALSRISPPLLDCPYLSISALWLGLVMAAMYCIMYLLASVLPAPLSPGGKIVQGLTL